MAVTINYPVAGLGDPTDHTAKTGAKVMVTGDTIFTVTGSIQIVSLVSECVTSNNATASTLKFTYVTAAASPQTVDMSGASTTLANAAVGYSVILTGASSLGESPGQSLAGVLLNTASRGVRVPAGAIKIVIAVGSTTGTWRHYMRWEPLETHITVTVGQ